MTSGWYSSRQQAFTYAQFQAVTRSQQAFTDVLAFGPTRFNLAKGGEARHAEGLWVSSNFLDVLGVKTIRGRGFARVTDEADCSQAGVVLSHAFWQSELAGQEAALGKDLYVDGRMLPILGVTPPEFIGLEPGRRFDVAMPLCMDTIYAQEPRARRLERRDAWWLTMVGRLKPGWNAARWTSSHCRRPSAATTSSPPLCSRGWATRWHTSGTPNGTASRSCPGWA
jgi:hypothetical protein